ncbi:MAG: hypothetical protein ABR899_06450 [Candidatus Krumholzibacteriaceae bacterium]
MNARMRLLAAVLVLAVAAGLFGVASAQEGAPGKAPPGKTPKVAIESKTVQLGEVLEGLDFTYTFKLKNVGDAELKILNVRPG